MDRQPLDVVIVGGSLAGLMHGNMIRALGHNVQIVEQASDERESHMAGVCCAADCIEYLRRYDRIKSPFTLRSQRLQALDDHGHITYYLKAPRQVTSWDCLYWRLRANFDGFAGDFYPDPPPREYDGAGRGSFLSSHKVTRVEADEPRATVHCVDLGSAKNIQLPADLVLAADGPNSALRQLYLPAAKRRFSGYVAWRGTVMESEVSDESRHKFEKNVTLNLMEEDHALIYIIPGNNGSLKEGERLLNFLWYTNETAESLDDIMVDQDGHRHQHIVPAGKIRQEVWQGVVSRGHLLSGPHREVMGKIKRPFVQVITDFASPKALLAGGKIMLVGDSLSLYRPHTASSANQAAFSCLALERYLKGEISGKQWEEQVLQFSRLHWLRSIWYGENYQRPLTEALPSAMAYWWAASVDTARTLWRWQPSNLRW